MCYIAHDSHSSAPFGFQLNNFFNIWNAIIYTQRGMQKSSKEKKAVLYIFRQTINQNKSAIQRIPKPHTHKWSHYTFTTPVRFNCVFIHSLFGSPIVAILQTGSTESVSVKDIIICICLCLFTSVSSQPLKVWKVHIKKCSFLSTTIPDNWH